jgi:c-di-GMP-binding flagellar brake protein YcgR
MRPRRILTPQETFEIFDHAVQHGELAVVTLQNKDNWRTFKCRFLERDQNRRFFVLDHQPAPDRPLPELSTGQYVGISFRYRSRKVMFATVVEAKGRFVIDNRESVSAVRYRWPESITELQRRAYFRTPIPHDASVVASVWPGGVEARQGVQSSALQVLSGRIVDLSCGGALVRSSQGAAPPWVDDQTLGLELNLADGRPPVLLNAHYRGVRHDPESNLCFALHFLGLEMTPDGRTVLQRIAACVQKFHRLALASAPRKAGARFRTMQ